MAGQGGDSTVLYRRMLGLSFRYWRMFLVAGAGMIVYAGTNTAFAWVVNRLLEVVGPGSQAPGEDDLRRWIPLAIMVLFLTRGAADVASSYGLGWIGRRVVTDIRQQVFDKFMRLPAQYFTPRRVSPCACSGGTQWRRQECAQQCAQTGSEAGHPPANANQATNENRA